jgi:hypothetical protein
VEQFSAKPKAKPEPKPTTKVIVLEEYRQRRREKELWE